MSVLAPPKESQSKLVKADNKFLQTALNSALREIVTLDDGRQVTKAQAVAESITNIACFAESPTDRIAASKFLFERVLGKAPVQKVEEQQETPKVIFSLTETSLEQVERQAREELKENDDDDQDPCVLVETDNGQEFIV